MPTFILVGFVSIRVPFVFVHEGAREINFLRVCHSKRDDRANFRVKGDIVGRGRLLVVRLLQLNGRLLLRKWGLLLRGWGRGL